jgi:hypothetical protein
MLSLVAGMWRRYLIYRNDPALKDGQVHLHTVFSFAI